MPKESQPHTTSGYSDGGQSPSDRACQAGDSGSESGPSHLMSSPDCRFYCFQLDGHTVGGLLLMEKCLSSL